MKKILLPFVLLIGFVGYSQEDNFIFDQKGLTDFVVTSCDGKTQSELYNKCLDWISVTYKNPSQVIKSKIENEYIRIEGFSSDIVCYSYMGKRCSDTKYEIEISFKEGRYKFDVLSISEFNNMSKSMLWTNFEINDTAAYFDKKGEIKKSYKYIPEMMPAYFNHLNLNLKDFMMSNSIPSKKTDW